MDKKPTAKKKRTEPIKWISCEDRLPRDRSLVLTYGACGFDICQVRVYGKDDVRFYGTAFWVSHWVYLVRPPKEDK